MPRDYLDALVPNRVIVHDLARTPGLLIYIQRQEKLYEMLATLLHTINTGAGALALRPGEERTDSSIRARLFQGIDLLLSGRIISVLLISLILISG